MPVNTEWKVELAISGPVTIRTGLTLNVEKGQIQPFWTTVSLTKAPHGVFAEVIARAQTPEEANDAAVYFIGQVLDFMCLQYNSPLSVGMFRTQSRPIDTNVKRIVEKEEWINAFRLGRDYGIKRPVFSRALSWYRKGVTTENPIDKLLAFWSSLEGVGAKFAERNEKTNQGAINQICNCFDQLWSDVASWKVIPNNAQWIKRFHDSRNGIAHGFIPVDVNTIRDIANDLPTLRTLTHTFLSDWETFRPEDEPQ